MISFILLLKITRSRCQIQNSDFNIIFFLFLLIVAGVAAAPSVESNKAAIELVQTHANYVWTLIAAALVFFMQAGFAMVEAGFTRAKNAINIMIKNMMDFSLN